jgi:hypothetical protein
MFCNGQIKEINKYDIIVEGMVKNKLKIIKYSILAQLMQI